MNRDPYYRECYSKISQNHKGTKEEIKEEATLAFGKATELSKILNQQLLDFYLKNKTDLESENNDLADYIVKMAMIMSFDKLTGKR